MIGCTAKKAWDGARTFWGKLCVVIFYSFIWMQILWAIQIVIAPKLGWECLFQDLSEFTISIGAVSLQVLNVLTPGVYLYAERFGIDLWNVVMLFVIYLCVTIVDLEFDAALTASGAPDCPDMAGQLSAVLWVTNAWSGLAVLTCFMATRNILRVGLDDEEAPGISEVLKKCNPISFLTNIWEKTSSAWGRICIATFYSFLWLQIFWAIIVLAHPKLGRECYFQDFTEYEDAMMFVYLREICVISISFFAYANVSGIQVWNVCMVFIFYLALSITHVVGIKSALENADHVPECDGTTCKITVVLWVTNTWTGFSLVASLLESRHEVRGGVGETFPLLVDEV